MPAAAARSQAKTRTGRPEGGPVQRLGVVRLRRLRSRCSLERDLRLYGLASVSSFGLDSTNAAVIAAPAERDADQRVERDLEAVREAAGPMNAGTRGSG
jgi:hypothetical protein